MQAVTLPIVNMFVFSVYIVKCLLYQLAIGFSRKGEHIFLNDFVSQLCFPLSSLSACLPFVFSLATWVIYLLND